MKFPLWKITSQIFTDRKSAGRYLNFREPLRTLECAGLHPLIGQASQKGLRLEAAAQPRCRGGAHGSPPRESRPLFSGLIFPVLHDTSGGMTFAAVALAGSGQGGLNCNTAGSQRCPLQHAPPFDSRRCCIFWLAFSSTSRTEPAKMFTVDP